MSRLVRELPHTVSWIWLLNSVDCHGGKTLATVMRTCLLFWEKMLSSMFSGAFSCQKVEKG